MDQLIGYTVLPFGPPTLRVLGRRGTRWQTRDVPLDFTARRQSVHSIPVGEPAGLCKGIHRNYGRFRELYSLIDLCVRANAADIVLLYLERLYQCGRRTRCYDIDRPARVRDLFGYLIL